MSQNRPETTAAIDNAAEITIAVVRARWNGDITSRLADGCRSELLRLGLREGNISVFEVPGAVELTFAAQKLAKSGRYDAVVVFGCVVRGDTPHFDYVCDSVTQGVTTLNTLGDVPVVFGLLTVENERQAYDRVGGPAGHKGIEAADAAVEMVAFAREVARAGFGANDPFAGIIN